MQSEVDGDGVCMILGCGRCANTGATQQVQCVWQMGCSHVLVQRVEISGYTLECCVREMCEESSRPCPALASPWLRMVILLPASPPQVVGSEGSRLGGGCTGRRCAWMAVACMSVAWCGVVWHGVAWCVLCDESGGPPHLECVQHNQQQQQPAPSGALGVHAHTIQGAWGIVGARAQVWVGVSKEMQVGRLPVSPTACVDLWPQEGLRCMQVQLVH